MKTSMIAVTALLAASRVYGVPDSPTKASRGEQGTKVSRQQAKGQQKPSTFPMPNAPTSHGCYGSAGNMTLHPVDNMSSGSCNKACEDDNFWVAGLHGPQCYCGYAYPPDKDVVDDQKCNYPCPSYDLEACGGLGKPGFWSVFNTGINVEAVAYEGASTTSSSSTKPTSTQPSSQSSSAPAVVTETEAPTESPDPDSSKKSGPNIAGIAAGVVAGVVGAAAIVGGIFFFLRRKRNAEIEEEHRRNAAVNAFINGSKPPGSSGSISMTDARLDPVLANRRMSDGSIADNEDYSRRILRVTNA
ncbi:hypothetical protein TOPH_06000 [Tolypocladium ophioglossoides CBS 100239]|uniref:WSC domain-containing protein n=1 Tax=Tolypocladium ophioglossoides (strain CBS 100239) TaxID=1163406 RepID=A0A0L0N623_TOLOC|nr:hypothetical protein TOPH_06000 [Tolypocladium ophioglossoides CBS 100239]